MSALAGIYNFTGAPVDSELALALGAALDRWGPDGGDEFIAGPLAMAYRAFHTNAESRLESQPLSIPRGCVLAWDGRLDNRDELMPLLDEELHDVSRPEIHTDVAIVAAAYLKWGEDFLQKIIGDFALALWDERAQRLLLARDAVGTRTLYYHVDGNRVMWSSVFEPILDLGGIAVDVDEEYIAGYLAVQTTPMDRTPYAGIYAVEPGCVVIVSVGRLEKRRHWKIDPSNEIRYRTDAEYEEHFRHLFVQAVRRRLRSDRPVWAEMSGGLDSTSIVCVADHLVETGQVSIPKVKTTSHFTEGTLNSDEGKYIRWVEQQRGMVGFHQRYDDHCMRFAAPEQRFYGHLTAAILHSRMPEALGDEMKEGGARLLLSGHGGDHLLWAIESAAPDLADLIYRGRLYALHQRTKTWSGIFNKSYFSVMLRDGVAPLLPELWQDRYHANLPGPPAWLEPALARHLAVGGSPWLPKDPFGIPTPGLRFRSRLVLKAIELAAKGGYRSVRCGDIVYPFLDRSLIEFLLSIPFNQIMRDGVQRSLQRRALGGLVYSKILKRKYKASSEDGVILGLNREWSRILSVFAHSRLVERGFVNRDRLREALFLARHGDKANTLQLMFTISLELWLRSVEHHYRASIRKANVASGRRLARLNLICSRPRTGDS